MTPEREAALHRFLREAGWGHLPLLPLAEDASPRQYFRLGSDEDPPGRRAVLMDDPTGGREAVGRFAALAEHLCALGFRAPRVLESELEHGILLLEDLGDDLFAKILRQAPGLERPCYEAAVDLLAVLGRNPPPPSVQFAGTHHRIDSYDLDPLLAEASLLTEWWLPAADAPVDRDAVAEYLHLVAESTRSVALHRNVLVLRDYHAENLLWLEAGGSEAWRRIGLLDFQDALAGHPAYDLVSLLEDARRDTSSALREAMHARYSQQAGLPPDQGSEFRAACAVLGAQRNLKILGIFARLCIRDGKPAYLDLMPRVWSHLMRDLTHPRLERLARWVRAHAPEPTRDARNRLLARLGSR